MRAGSNFDHLDPEFRPLFSVANRELSRDVLPDDHLGHVESDPGTLPGPPGGEIGVEYLFHDHRVVDAVEADLYLRSRGWLQRPSPGPYRFWQRGGIPGRVQLRG